VITMRIRIVAAPARQDEVRATLLSLAGPVRSQSGCTGSRVFTDLDEDNTLTFETEWKSRLELEGYLHIPAFRSLLAAMDLACEAPTFEVDELRRRSGFEFVEEVLGANEKATANGLA
jgi:quinol monooxygenase YgiN